MVAPFEKEVPDGVNEYCPLFAPVPFAHVPVSVTPWLVREAGRDSVYPGASVIVWYLVPGAAFALAGVIPKVKPPGVIPLVDCPTLMELPEGREFVCGRLAV